MGQGAKKFFRRNKGKQKRMENNEERERLLSDEEEEEEEPLPSARLRVQVPNPVERRRLVESVIREEEEEDEDDDAGEISWLLLRPGKKRVRRWMASWWKRWALLVGLPCVVVSCARSCLSNIE